MNEKTEVAPPRVLEEAASAAGLPTAIEQAERPNRRPEELRGADLRGQDLTEVEGLLPEHLAGADLTGAKLPDDIAKFPALGQVTAISSEARKIFIGLLAACVYSWLVIGTTTDVALILNTASSPLPIINTPVPIAGFYVVGAALLQGASLSLANLQGANLFLAQLQGANLRGAWLQVAHLLAAQLQGADLSYAYLQGADLQRAFLQGADLRGAQLQGAFLGETQLQGADLRETAIWRVQAGDALLDLADLRRSTAKPMTDSAIDALISAATTGILDWLSRSLIAERLNGALRTAERPAGLDFPEEWRSEPNVMFEPGDPVHEPFEWGRPNWTTEDAYDEDLAKFLADLACGRDVPEAQAHGLALRALNFRNRLFSQRLAARLLADCPPAEELPEDMRRDLERVAARLSAEPKEPTAPETPPARQ